MKIFVYGTLRKDCGRRMEGFAPTAQFVGNGYINGLLVMNNYPTVLTNVKDFKIQGEVYEVESENELRRLDEYEGYPCYYNKENGVVYNQDGSKLCDATWYFQPEPAKTGIFQFEIKSGDFKTYLEEKNANL